MYNVRTWYFILTQVRCHLPNDPDKRNIRDGQCTFINGCHSSTAPAITCPRQSQVNQSVGLKNLNYDYLFESVRFEARHSDCDGSSGWWLIGCGGDTERHCHPSLWLRSWLLGAGLTKILNPNPKSFAIKPQTRLSTISFLQGYWSWEVNCKAIFFFQKQSQHIQFWKVIF